MDGQGCVQPSKPEVFTYIPDRETEIAGDKIILGRAKAIADNSKWDKMASRMKKDQLFHRFQKEKEERMLQQCLCKGEKDKIYRERQMAQEQNFAEAMKEMKEDEVREAAFKKQLFECSPEIRELQHEIRRAYFAKTLYAQRMEKEARDLEEKMRQHEMHQVLLEALAKYDREEAERAEKREKDKCDYRAQLKHQLTDSTSKEAVKKEEFEKDKKIVDEIIESIEREEMDDLKEKMSKVSAYREEIRNFLTAREEQRQQDKAHQEIERQRDLEYLNRKEEQKLNYNKAKEDRDAKKASIIAKAIETIMQAQYQNEELEELRRELHEEELAESVRRKEAEEEEKKRRHMEELRQAEAEARKLRAQKIAADKEEDEKYKQELMERFAEEERLSQMTLQKRKQREREHRLKVEEMILERRAARAAERESQLAVRNCFDEDTARRQALIDMERVKLLKEHGPKLLGFIPKGTIKSQKELEQLGEPFVNYYRNGHLYRTPHPSTVDFEECEEELFKNMTLSKNATY